MGVKLSLNSKVIFYKICGRSPLTEPNGILSTESNKVIEDFSLKSGITSTIIGYNIDEDNR